MTSRLVLPGAGAVHAGNTGREENFPVGSLLLPAATRPCVAAFYAFARTADDVADDPVLTSDHKLVLLDGMEAALLGLPGDESRVGPASALRRILLAQGMGLDQPRALLEAFRRDAVGPTCRTWADLMDYCRVSAAPVGRFMLELHGEGRAATPASDALCAALQVQNHLQDCREDFLALGRVYLPGDWLEAEGLAPESLGAHAADAALRRVFGRVLDGVDSLLEEARPLPGLIACRGLRLEASVILTMSGRFSARLRGGDPLASRIGHAWYDWLFGVGVGLARAGRAR
ncbi:MAG: squalene/phytoene synthase family protein [Alphaproteobacteria bacterium]